MGSDHPGALRRTVDTVRPGAPASAVRVKRAAKVVPPTLSVVERHAVSPHTCASLECPVDADAEVFVRTPLGALTVVVMLCRACAAMAPKGLHVVPIEKGRR